VSDQASNEPLLSIAEDYAQRLIHPWFAVRGGTTARVAVTLTLLPSWASEHERLEWLATVPPDRLAPVLHEAASKLQLSERQSAETPRLLDLCAGVGTIAFAGTELGCDATALELNSVACLIARCHTDFPVRHGSSHPEPVAGGAHHWEGLEAEFRRWASFVLDLARQDTGDAWGGEIEAIIRTRVVRCPNPNCGALVPLINDPRLGMAQLKKLAPSSDMVAAHHRDRPQ
jgi:putative DNA methylase